MLDTFPKTTVDVFALVLESGGCKFQIILFVVVIYIQKFAGNKSLVI